MSDFDDHFQYPRRLEYGQVGNPMLTKPVSVGGSGEQGVRRVRPVVVPPPPGFLKAPLGPTAVASARPDGGSMSATFDDGRSVKYANYVKMRALAGALAGDWSSKCVPD